MILNLGNFSGSEAMLKARKIPKGEDLKKIQDDQRKKYFDDKVIELMSRGVNQNLVHRLSRVNLSKVLNRKITKKDLKKSKPMVIKTVKNFDTNSLEDDAYSLKSSDLASTTRSKEPSEEEKTEIEPEYRPPKKFMMKA